MRSFLLLAAAVGVVACSSESDEEPRAADPVSAEPAAEQAAPDPDAPPRSIDGAPPGGVLDLSPGTLVRARLETGDRALVDGSLGDDYGLTLAEGEAVTIVARGGRSADAEGGTLDVQAFLLFNGQDVASDDDSAIDGDARNARIVFSPPVRGFYVLRVTTSGAGTRTGEYEVQIYPGGRLAQR